MYAEARLQWFAMRASTKIWFAGTIAFSAMSAAAQTFSVHPTKARQPLDVLIHPGDRVALVAGDCVPGPDGRPRPLVQDDPEIEGGLIFIPGVTMRFVPIAELAGRDLFVPRELEFPEPARVWLDWGRSYRNALQGPGAAPAVPRPCEGPEKPPSLEIHIAAGSTPPEPAAGSLTLEFRRYDANLLPLNPSWAGGARPDVCAACDGFRIERGARKTKWIPALQSPRCTTQSPYVDAGGCRLGSADCPGKGKRLNGHVNWGPATFTGLLSTFGGGPVHVSLDGDVNFYLEPQGGAGLLTQQPKSRYLGVIGVEFASAETLRWFRTPWWKPFPFRRSSYHSIVSLWKQRRRHSDASGAFPSVRRLPATVIGIFGIDMVHGAHPEIHPAQAIAIQTQTNLEGDVYQVFARNWGTGGDCAGRLDTRLQTPRIALLLPDSARKSYAGAEGVFLDHGIEVSSWKVHARPEAATLVIDLPADRPCSVVEGQLVLRPGGAGPGPEGPHWTSAAVAPAEPIRLEIVPGGHQLCVQAKWFMPVR